MYANTNSFVACLVRCVVPCCGSQDASSSLERLRTDLRSWTTRVEAGELQNIGQREPSSGVFCSCVIGMC